MRTVIRNAVFHREPHRRTWTNIADAGHLRVAFVVQEQAR